MLDLDKLLAIYRELRDITARSSDEHRHLDVPETEYMLDGLEQGHAFSGERKQQFAEYMQARIRGYICDTQSDFGNACQHHRRSLELGKSLFEEGDYFVIDAQLRIARSLLLDKSPAGLVEGTQIALGVRDILQKQSMTNSYHYREACDILTKLYSQRNMYDRAVEIGEATIKLYDSQGESQLGAAALLTSVVAECANRAGNHKKALEIAKSGIDKKPLLVGKFAPASLRLLSEYARAKIALGETEGVDRAFDKIVSLSDQFANDGYYSVELRIEHREEYLAFLKKLGDSGSNLYVRWKWPTINQDRPWYVSDDLHLRFDRTPCFGYGIRRRRNAIHLPAAVILMGRTPR
ncbi:hypothetical protein [Bremerella cremea]|uniref:hypothetical protein n=1 Tax=Bremerella cremea TaxID=1031537 RepID=UPI0011C05DFB|nr:hypothetical protein [Bremerella cremea]